MYEFSRGPLVWIALSVFFFGSLIKLLLIIIQAKKDKVVHPYWNLKFGTRSLIHWMIPYGSVNMRKKPLFTALSFLFHLCLLMTPIFALGHVMLWDESWGVSWWTLPDGVTNLMTFVVVVTGAIFILRRIADPTVRYVTSWKEYLLVILAIAPFITGLMAYHQIFDYDYVIVIHMWTGALWLIAIPFTWLSHMFYFPFTRSYMGSEFGYVRNAKDW